jgi:flagellin-like protein
LIGKKIGEKEMGVSPVIAVILMVAITVVLAGIVYYWVSNFSGSSDSELSYVGVSAKTVGDHWEISIERVTGQSISFENINFLIYQNGINLYKRTIFDVNPQPFMAVDDSLIYPIANNDTAVISYSTSQPITPADDFEDYVGAMFLILDNNKDYKLSSGDVIWIYSDVDGDGVEDIKVGQYFKIRNLAKTHEILSVHL